MLRILKTAGLVKMLFIQGKKIDYLPGSSWKVAAWPFPFGISDCLKLKKKI